MFTTHATLAALLALSSGQWIQPRIFDQPNLRSGNGRAAVDYPYFEFAPSSGAGLPVISHHKTALCDALAAEVPSWNTPVDGGAGNWCLGGDGLAVAGSEVTFALVGTPSVVSAPVCPSGLDCLAATGQPVNALQLTSTTATAATAARATGTGPLSVCWLGKVNTASTVALATGSTGGATGTISWYMESGAAVTFYVSSGSVLRTPSVTAAGAGELSLYCFTHDGTGAVNVYKNGAAGTASAAVSRQSLSAKPTVNGTNGTSTGGGATDAYGVLSVDSVLSAAQIAAIARRVLADQPKAVINGSPSLAMTYTRTGPMFCSKADNTGSIIPANRPCIAQDGILVEGAATNQLQNSSSLSAANWGLYSGTVGLPTRTANYAAAPDGTMTASRFEFPAASGAGWTTVADTSMPDVPTYTTVTASVYAKGTTAAGDLDVCLACAAGWCCSTCAVTSTAWTRCTKTYTGAAVSGRVAYGHMSTWSSVTHQADDILLWGTQVESGSVATSYKPTTSAAAAAGDVLAYFDLGSEVGPGANSFSAAATTTTSDARVQYPFILRASQLQTDAAGKGVWLYSNATFGANFRCFANNDAAVLNATGVLTNRAGRAACWSGGSDVNFTWGAGTATVGGSSSGTYSKARWIDIGNHQGLSALGAFGGRISNVCLDPRPTRCR